MGESGWFPDLPEALPERVGFGAFQDTTQLVAWMRGQALSGWFSEEKLKLFAL